MLQVPPNLLILRVKVPKNEKTVTVLSLSLNLVKHRLKASMSFEYQRVLVLQVPPNLLIINVPKIEKTVLSLSLNPVKHHPMASMSSEH